MANANGSYDEKRERLGRDVAWAVYAGIEDGLKKQGRVLYGLNAVFKVTEVLLIVKVEVEGRREVAFVGASTWSHALAKAAREIRDDKLRWKEDQWAKART